MNTEEWPKKTKIKFVIAVFVVGFLFMALSLIHG